jgi:hypothetical protein
MVAALCCVGGRGGAEDRDGGAVMKVAVAARHRDGRQVKTAVNGGNGGW